MNQSERALKIDLSVVIILHILYNKQLNVKGLIKQLMQHLIRI